MSSGGAGVGMCCVDAEEALAAKAMVREKQAAREMLVFGGKAERASPLEDIGGKPRSPGEE